MNLPALTEFSEKDVKFVREYTSNDGDAVAACRVAGLLDKQFPVALTAEKTLARPEIAFAIRVVQQGKTYSDKIPETREEAAARAQILINMGLETRNVPAATAASRYQSELLGLLDKTVNVNLKHDIRTFSTAELEKIVARGIVDVEFEEVVDGSKVLE